MTRFLVANLTATLSSHGDLAGHERRGSLAWPGRSAILGLVGASLGIRRDDVESQHRLQGLNCAVAVFRPGAPLIDFHTYQSVPAAAVKAPPTRKAALQAGKRIGRVETSLSQREYRQDGVYRIVLWGCEFPLEDIASALRKPVFHLYLGRKSCPLSTPMLPTIVSAASPVDAMRDAYADDILADTLDASWPPAFAVSDPGPGIQGDEVVRYDQATDRKRWHFKPRRAVMIRSIS